MCLRRTGDSYSGYERVSAMTRGFPECWDGMCMSGCGEMILRTWNEKSADIESIYTSLDEEVYEGAAGRV